MRELGQFLTGLHPAEPSPGLFQSSRPGTDKQKGMRSKEIGMGKEELERSGVEEQGLGGWCLVVGINGTGL